jgi:hypothetical protein
MKSEGKRSALRRDGQEGGNLLDRRVSDVLMRPMPWRLGALAAAVLSCSLACAARQVAWPPHAARAAPSANTLAASSTDGDSPAAVRPCDPSSSEYREARHLFEKIDREVQAAAPDADPGPIVAELVSLGTSHCFDIGGRLDFPEQKTDHDGRPDTAYSLKAFWQGGGRDWIAGYLDLAVPVAAGAERFLSTQSTFARTLSLETHPRSPLAPLLCSVRDEGCAATTLPFRRRFEGLLAVYLAGKRVAEQQAGFRSFLGLGECVGASKQLTKWVECLESLRERQPRLPLPGIRRPTRGWLYVSAAEGMSDPLCEEERAYDLATGAAFKVRTCQNLVFAPSGGVEWEATEKTRTTKTEQGSTQTMALSEATWFLLQKDSLDIEVKAEGIAVPNDIIPTYEPRASVGRRGGGFGCGCSDCEGPSWTYLLDGHVIGQGSTRWDPGCWSDDEEAETYATELLAVAEELFTAGCTTEAAPVARPPRRPARRDGHATMRDRALDAAWNRLALRGTCPP